MATARSDANAATFKYGDPGRRARELLATSACPRCGAANAVGVRFCSYCGTPLLLHPPAYAPGAPPGAYGAPSTSAPWALPSSPPTAVPAEEVPTGAAILSILGGVFILIGGIIEAFVGAVVSGLTNGAAGGIASGFGVLGALMGILILVLGILLLTNPDNHVTYGVLILVFSLVSLTSFAGGFFIGFLLSLIGAILALTWKPYSDSPRTYVYQSPPMR